MSVDFSIVTPTNARPYCLERLLASLTHFNEAPQQVLVGNSTAPEAPEWVHRWYENLSKTPNIEMIQLAPNQGPGSSRKALVARCSSRFVMMLDDDHVATASSNLLLQTILGSPYDAVGGIWLQDKRIDYKGVMTEPDALLVRDRKPSVPAVNRVCFGFNTTVSSDARQIIKTPVVGSPQFKSLLKVDDLMPSLVVRREVFDKINFDEQFRYFFEWFDFFMQAKRAGIRCATYTGAHFLHCPERYACATAAQLNPRKEDGERFFQKWGLIPLFSHEARPSKAV